MDSIPVTAEGYRSRISDHFFAAVMQLDAVANSMRHYERSEGGRPILHLRKRVKQLRSKIVTAALAMDRKHSRVKRKS